MKLFHNRPEAEEGNGKDKTLVVHADRCPQNHACPSVGVCPAGALVQLGFAAPAVDQSRCIRCGKCVKFCPRRALTLE